MVVCSFFAFRCSGWRQEASELGLALWNLFTRFVLPEVLELLVQLLPGPRNAFTLNPAFPPIPGKITFQTV
jgi:hypothetical protein